MIKTLHWIFASTPKTVVEFYNLANDLNGMLGRIENVFLSVKGMSDTLDSASQSLQNNATTNQSNAESLQTNMESVAAGMTELKQTSAEITSNVHTAIEAARAGE